MIETRNGRSGTIILFHVPSVSRSCGYATWSITGTKEQLPTTGGAIFVATNGLRKENGMVYNPVIVVLALPALEIKHHA